MENTRIGPFLIGGRLGSNRRQKVYRATQVEQNIDVAIKFIGAPSEAIRGRAIDKLQREFEQLKQLQHPNLVRVLGAGIENNEVFIATELVSGESLTTKLSRRGKLASDSVVDYGRQAAQALDYLHHQDLVHGKLTPDKVLIDDQGVVKLTDLRLNRTRKKQWNASRQRELDIAAYLAPEQMTGGATPKTDIYSLGIILYEMLTGRLPYEPDTMGRLTRRKLQEPPAAITEFVMNCPIWLDQLVCRMISPDPKLRPHTAKAVILAMDELRVIAETQKSSVQQVSGSFNPLTAGADKTEANRILGIRKKPETKIDLWQSPAVLIAGLVLVMGILVLAMLPTSSQQNFVRAQNLMQSDDPADWGQARDYLSKILERGSQHELYPQAESLFYESRRRTLVQQAERGRITGLHSPGAQRFIEAVRDHKDGRFVDSAIGLRKLLGSIDPHGDERHIYQESSLRLEQVELDLGLPTDLEAVLELIEQQKNLTQRDDIQSGMDILKKIIDSFLGKDGYHEAVLAAQPVWSSYEQLPNNDSPDSMDEPLIDNN